MDAEPEDGSEPNSPNDRPLVGQFFELRPEWSGKTRDKRSWPCVGAAKRRIGYSRWAATGHDAHAIIPFVSGPHPGRRLSCHKALLTLEDEPDVPFPPLAACPTTCCEPFFFAHRHATDLVGLGMNGTEFHQERCDDRDGDKSHLNMGCDSSWKSDWR